MQSLPRVDNDGLPSRDSGPWAADKLYYISRYFYAFNQAMKHKGWPRRAYADLLAGPGRCVDRETGECFEGSPLLALRTEPSFTHHIFVEGDPVGAAALRQRLTAAGQSPYLVFEQDCNSGETIARLRDVLAQPLGLLFVDTLALDTVRFETLRQLTTSLHFDLIYTFQISDALRNLDRAQAAQSQRYGSGLGSEWAPAWQAYRRPPFTSDADALTAFFEQQLRSLGYNHVEGLHTTMKNSKNASLYRLVLASHHETAIKLWRNVSAIESTGQRRMF